jgi:hypothetical protein
MRPDSNAVLGGKLNRLPNVRGVGCVKAARHIRRGYKRHHLGIVADAINAESLSHIAVQID